MAVQLPEISSPVVPGFVGIEAEPGVAARRRRQTIARNLELYLPLGGIIFMILACFLGPVVFPIAGPEAGTYVQALEAPLSHGHILGTDPLGFDILSRILYGGRVSLEVGCGAQAVGLTLGSMIGQFAAFKGGVTESIIMRCIDLLLAFPGLVI